ncbi:MAG: D-aminoacylase [Gammaproteobacteria bacterium]|nr:D-aminoacylase [Gammaproteobacteria bacterium]
MAQFDTLIRGGRLVDGSGAAPFVADIAIKDGVIAAIGKAPGSASRVIDADGLTVTPGWVDIHTHYDGQVSWDPELAQSVRHGVTTAVMGNCGVGFAPVEPARRDWLIGLMEGVEDIPGESLKAGINWQWESFPEYLEVLDATPRTFDIAAQLAHGALRAYVMGERGAANEAATAADIARMAELTEQAMRAGAVGFTSSRTAVHIAVDGRPVPGTFAAEDELVAIARAVKASGRGLVEMVSPGIVGEDCAGLDNDMALMHRIAADSGCTVMFLLLQHNVEPAQWRRQLAVCEAAAAAGHRLIPQVAGRPISILFSFEGEHPWRFMPSYQALSALPFAERYAAMSDPAIRARLLAETDPNDIGFSLIYKNPTLWDNTYVAGSPIDYTPPHTSSVAAIARGRGQSPWATAYDLLLAEGGHAFLAHFGVNYADGNPDALHAMLRHPLSVFGLSDAGAHGRFILDAGVHTYMLTRWSRDATPDDPLHLPVESVVRKLTRNNAALYGFPDRGQLALGLRADINLIDLDKLGAQRPHMTYDLPANMPRLTQQVDGYVATLVRGAVVQEHGALTGARPGRVLRSRGT